MDTRDDDMGVAGMSAAGGAGGDDGALADKEAAPTGSDAAPAFPPLPENLDEMSDESDAGRADECEWFDFDEDEDMEEEDGGGEEEPTERFCVLRSFLDVDGANLQFYHFASEEEADLALRHMERPTEPGVNVRRVHVSDFNELDDALAALRTVMDGALLEVIDGDDLAVPTALAPGGEEGGREEEPLS